MNLPELITDSLEAYERVALSLAQDTSSLERLRRRIAAGRETAFENSHERLAPRWAALLEGFAERADG